MYKIGETIEYMSGDCDALMSNKLGVITEIASDNFDVVKVFENDEGSSGREKRNVEIKYWSKKTKSFRPVKEKDMGTIYYTVETPNMRYPEYVEISQIVGKSPRPVAV